MDFTYDYIQADGVNFSSDVFDTIAYNVETKELAMEFHSGSDYIYSDVNESTWQAFAEADSKGGFWNKYLKGKFTSTEDVVYFTEREEDEVAYASDTDALGEVVANPTRTVLDGTTEYETDFPNASRRYEVQYTVEGFADLVAEYFGDDENEVLRRFGEDTERVLRGHSVKVKALVRYFD